VYNVVTMSDNTVLHVKLDPELKKQAQEAAADLGLPLSTVVSANLRQFVQTRSITISDTPKLKPEVAKELRTRVEAARKGIDVSPGFTDMNEARKWLES
jgi:antitoxin component of RelBE/YafQ-DinJ toxin-antitoxin module